MLYKSTRGDNLFINSSEAIIKGIADDGGLYVPAEIPGIDKPVEDLLDMDYRELALYILKKYLTDFDEDELRRCIWSAYDDKFDTTDIAPLREADGVSFLELYHGPTLAFKDMALSLLPHLLKTSMKMNKIDKEVVILTATSGDTGKAALEGFAGIEGTRIIVFFPEEGVSEIQKRQMITQEGRNTFVVGIKGNFDDAQNGVKGIFNDKEFSNELYEKGYILSSANSINIGRLVPQIVYYFYGYLNLLKHGKMTKGEKINIVVPTGNFGNILSAYYAKKMGLPVNKLICASNENNVLYDFFRNGTYDMRRELKLTSSPSMDILISSNLERLLYEISGRDSGIIKNLMYKLSKEKNYSITESMKENLRDFYGGYASGEEVLNSIGGLFKSSGYVIDTHTAVAYTVYKKYTGRTGDSTKTIIASTASPFKFGRSVLKALGESAEGFNDFEVVELLSRKAEIEIPKAVKELKDKKILHRNICSVNEMKFEVERFLGVNIND